MQQIVKVLLGQDSHHDLSYDLRRAVGTARDRIEENGDKGRRLPPDSRFLHLRDVTYRDGRSTHTLPTWRGPVAAVSGWTLGEPEKS
ncbi:hypothetical protein ACIGZJ_34440 [Kitasatospora sp. NPDC052868]|uniref:hypothetical protein n=1 Tax=Kitasatospora sp. NPDC052868 TaxID=3364060 RepID=UPI0037C50BDA